MIQTALGMIAMIAEVALKIRLTRQAPPRRCCPTPSVLSSYAVSGSLIAVVSADGLKPGSLAAPIPPPTGSSDNRTMTPG